MAEFVQSLSFHPQAYRPNFLWTAQLPVDWAFVDTHPASWRRQVERVIDDFYSGQRLAVGQRKAVRAQMEQAVKAAQDNKVLLFFVLPGVLDDGEMSACTLLVRWQNFSPQSASMTVVDSAFCSRDGFEHKTTSGGVAYALFGGKTQVGLLTDRRDAWNWQAAVPVVSTSWVVVVSGMAPTEELGVMLRDCVVRLVDSMRFFPEETGRVLDAVVGGDGDVGNVIAGEDDVVVVQADGSPLVQ